MSRHYSQHEDGRISVLVIGLTFLVMAILTVAMVITSVHTQRRQLYACADTVALSAAQEVKGTDFYTTGELHTLSEDVKKVVQQRFDFLVTNVCAVGESPLVTAVSVDESELEVVLETVPSLPIVSRYMSFLTEPMKIRVASIVSVTKSRSVEE
ncbi:hypothetical protein NXS08_00580 [Gleimia sp. 6138-11-ORH1]|uniref:Tad domain-containing protein n=1 Tax=Gleimia sp. 6138-11-ORH1 TaxID=2973937 RepID=UPI002167E13A|nr:Tad domain-containing protein [Gleimia sp. 6138-11-ORH1]MCS4483988.1 hypothetical protein [Gleimia sp. 6138-11-ORH1]